MTSEPFTRRKLLATGTATSLGMGLAGCADRFGGGDGSNDGSGKSLRISISTDPGSPLNSYISSAASWDWLNDLVFDRLLLPSPHVEEPIPGLATETKQVSDDATTWTATIREGVEWHDGEPFTAEDIVFSYRYYRDGPHSRFAHHVNQVPKIETIEAEDEKTVRFECAYPTPTLASITFADLPVFSKHVWEDVEKPREYTELPVGTGPYKLVEYTEGERLRFEATDNYFLGDPLVDEIVVPFIPDQSATFTALNNGEIDSTDRPVPPEMLSRFRQTDEVELVTATQLMSIDLRVDFTSEPFRTHEFRGALSRAIDKDAITDVVMLGEAISGSEGFPHPRSHWTAPDLKMPHDPEGARKVFDELGYEDRDGDGVRESSEGEPLSFSVTAPSNEPHYIRAAELIADQLGDVGMDIDVRTVDPGTVRGFYGNFDYDMYIFFTNVHMAADPDQFLMNFRGGMSLLWNTQKIPYPEYEALEEKYFVAETLDEQVEVLHEIQRLNNQQPALIPLWYPLSHQAYRPGAHDAWAESPGYGINHKFSLLPEEVRGSAVTESFD